MCAARNSLRIVFQFISPKIKVSSISCNSRVLGRDFLNTKHSGCSFKCDRSKSFFEKNSKLRRPGVPDRGICFPHNNNSACEKFVCSKAKTINDSAHSFIWHKWHTQMNNMKAENKPELLFVEIYRVYTCARPCLRLAINISTAFRVTQCRQRLCSLTNRAKTFLTVTWVINYWFCNRPSPLVWKSITNRAHHWNFNLPNLRHLLGRARRPMERERNSFNNRFKVFDAKLIMHQIVFARPYSSCHWKHQLCESWIFIDAECNQCCIQFTYIAIRVLTDRKSFWMKIHWKRKWTFEIWFDCMNVCIMRSFC